MPVADLVLDVVAQTTLNASGAGSVKLGPTSARQTWNVTNAAVAVSSDNSEPTATLYLNTQASKLAGTATGSNDSTALDVTLRNGYILCVWTGGDAGAIATLSLQGSIHLGA